MIKIASTMDAELFEEFSNWCKANCVGSWAAYDDYIGYHARKWRVYLHHEDDIVMAMLKFSDVMTFEDF